MADGTLHPGAGGGMAFGNGGIKLLGHRMDHICVLNRHNNGFAQIAVPQDVSRNSQLMHGFGDQKGHIGVGGAEGWSGEQIGRSAAKAPIYQRAWA